MPLKLALYRDQTPSWPQAGQHILAQYDAETITVYQAYRPTTAQWAIDHGTFGDGFSYNRMSWIKPNFLWMMYRSGWGTKEGQETTLGLRLRRKFFDKLLAQAVNSTYCELQFPSRDQWREAVSNSSVRIQWDPDHAPSGASIERRALQLGLRNEALEAFGKSEILEVIDLSAFVIEQRSNAYAERLSLLQTPEERIYMPSDLATCRTLGLTIY